MNNIKKILILSAILCLVSIVYITFLRNNKSSISKNLNILTNESNISETSSETVFRLSEDSRYKIPIQIAEASNEEFNSAIELTGEITADPDNTQTIGTRLKGKVLEIRKKEGDPVRKGDILVVMDSPEVARLKSKYLTSLAKLQATQKNTERIKELVKIKLAADQEARNAEAESLTWEMEVKADKENLIMNDIPIPKNNLDSQSADSNQNTKIYLRSSINGTLIMRHVSPGNIVAENTIFVTVANLNNVWFAARAFENDLKFLKLGENVKVSINAYPDQIFTGKLSFIGSSIEKETRSIPARITLNNSNNLLKIGLFGKALLNVDSIKQDKILIPDSCLLTINGKDGVFIQINDLTYEWKEIKLGGTQGKLISIEEGLKNGDKIVSSGAYSLKAIYLKHTFGEE
ncbi:MAG: efflux RND transporter periplasmic adaptor subunit [Leptospiraceae bacterium]|nr:efflux RND transporter periplasmic adaptor subunit [Leptospiraceae bacterium]